MIRAFAFALLMLLGALPAAAQVVPYGQLNQSQQIAVIARAVEAGDTGLAQILLSGSRFTEGDLGYQAAFLQARVFRAEGAFAEAEELLRKILKERPEFRAVRAELAGLLAERGKGRAARLELRSLAAGASNPDERWAFEALLDRVGSESGLKFSGFAALLSDTNINSGTDAVSVNILGIPFPVPASQRRTSGEGLRFGGTALWEHSLGRGRSLYGAGRITADEYRGTAFDRHVLDLRFGYKAATERGFWGFEASADRHWLAHQGAETGLGWRLYGAQGLAPRWRLSGEVRGGQRWYDSNTGGDRDMAALRMRLDHALGRGFTVWGELELGREEVKAQPITGFDRRRVALGLDGTLGNGLGFAVSAAQALDGYHALYPGLATAREDRRSEVSLSLWHGKLQVRGFMPRVSVSKVVNRSNAALHRFDKVETSMTLVKRF